jgi:hypothetical protein
MQFDITTDASPGQVLQALTDFSERRPRIWHRTLDPTAYELLELGDTWAIARESTAGSPFWVVERYDWSDPTVVRWVDVETSWGGLGSGQVRIVPLTVAAAESRPNGTTAAPRAGETRCWSGCFTEGRCIASSHGVGEGRWTSTRGRDMRRSGGPTTRREHADVATGRDPALTTAP